MEAFVHAWPIANQRINACRDVGVKRAFAHNLPQRGKHDQPTGGFSSPYTAI